MGVEAVAELIFDLPSGVAVGIEWTLAVEGIRVRSEPSAGRTL